MLVRVAVGAAVAVEVETSGVLPNVMVGVVVMVGVRSNAEGLEGCLPRKRWGGGEVTAGGPVSVS